MIVMAHDTSSKSHHFSGFGVSCTGDSKDDPPMFGKVDVKVHRAVKSSH